VEVDGTTASLFDLAGAEDTRHCWRRHAGWPTLQGFVFVVDSADAERMHEASTCLQSVLAERPERCQVAVLVYLNKQDLPGALSGQAAFEALGLPAAAAQHPFRIQPCSAEDASGLQEGMVWLLDEMDARRRDLAAAATAGGTQPADTTNG